MVSDGFLVPLFPGCLIFRFFIRLFSCRALCPGLWWLISQGSCEKPGLWGVDRDPGIPASDRRHYLWPIPSRYQHKLERSVLYSPTRDAHSACLTSQDGFPGIPLLTELRFTPHSNCPGWTQTRHPKHSFYEKCWVIWFCVTVKRESPDLHHISKVVCA